MDDICKNWYENWKKKYEEHIELWNTDKEECCKKITGYDTTHAAYRYMKIDGAVNRMGGWANFSDYVNRCADDDYMTFKKLEDENRKLKSFIKYIIGLRAVGYPVKEQIKDKYNKMFNK